MIKGSVDARQRAWIPLETGNGAGNFRPMVFVVDTGFDGDLTLSRESINQLGLAEVAPTMVTLATGVREQVNTWGGYILWHGRHRYVEVLETRGNPLMGTRLLEGSQLTVQMRVNEEVVIEELDETPA